jgi:predicted O-methyltransferase YrrM
VSNPVVTLQPGLPRYAEARYFPSRVWRAVEESRRRDFPLACIPEVGRLLRFCAGLRGIVRICELGTAYGVGAAWIETGMASGATLLTVELDPERARAAQAMFADNPAVEVLAADWSLALERGPFDMLFSDGGPKRAPGDPEKLLPLVRTGALVVLDDFTPGADEDGSREIWLGNPSYDGVEVQVAKDASVILARRR